MAALRAGLNRITFESGFGLNIGHMEVARWWRGQEQRYFGPGQKLFEYQHTQSETGEQRALRCKLVKFNTELLPGQESGCLVESLRHHNFNDETIAKVALELAATDRGLGLPFAVGVMSELNQAFDTEAIRLDVMRTLGYSSEAILDWHFSVDGYAADAKAWAQLQTLVLETA